MVDRDGMPQTFSIQVAWRSSVLCGKRTGAVTARRGVACRNPNKQTAFGVISIWRAARIPSGRGG